MPGGRLTTHVLDTALGRPAAGVVAEVVRFDGDTATAVAAATTNADGRVDGPLLSGEAFRAGVYEIRFHAGEYLRRTGAAVTDPAFLEVIPIRFSIADPDQHYHVPLLVSAYGYSTYRGS